MRPQKMKMSPTRGPFQKVISFEPTLDFRGFLIFGCLGCNSSNLYPVVQVRIYNISNLSLSTKVWDSSCCKIQLFPVYMYCTAHNLFNFFAIHNKYLIFQHTIYIRYLHIHPSVKIPFKNTKCLYFQE